MNRLDRSTMLRAWRDPVYRAGLSAEMLAQLPPHPAGEALQSEELQSLLPGITLGGGCGTAGCTHIVCTDPCTRTNWVQCPNTSDGGGCTP